MWVCILYLNWISGVCMILQEFNHMWHFTIGIYHKLWMINIMDGSVPKLCKWNWYKLHLISKEKPFFFFLFWQMVKIVVFYFAEMTLQHMLRHVFRNLVIGWSIGSHSTSHTRSLYKATTLVFRLQGDAQTFFVHSVGVGTLQLSLT